MKQQWRIMLNLSSGPEESELKDLNDMRWDTLSEAKLFCEGLSGSRVLQG